ncbi:MAG: flavin reductase family protein [Candidatus Omnitrophica bacterium]|nr:flavin reductase family protein [Candidatus Omnitrophota bacterium]
MAKRSYPPQEALYPAPVVLVSCGDIRSGQTNIITIAWCGIVCSNPPQISVSIRPSRLSHKIISEKREFAVNIPKKHMLKSVDLCGMKSGKDTDKFAASGFTPVSASKISAPIIKECPVNIECLSRRVISLGTHDIFIGEVVAVNIDDEVLAEDGKIDYSKADPLVYNQGQYWSLDKMLGPYGLSSTK